MTEKRNIFQGRLEYYIFLAKINERGHNHKDYEDLELVKEMNYSPFKKIIPQPKAYYLFTPFNLCR